MEKRFLSSVCTGIELRFAADLPDNVKVDVTAADAVSGYAAKFNTRSQPLWGFVEEIAPGAFDNVLDQDVVALFNHDPNMPLARTTAGTLRLSVDDVGLRYEFDLADDYCSEQVAKFINDGRVSGSSFGFTVAMDGERWDRMPDGVVLRTITRLERLFDVSPVTYPAYLDTNVQLRAEAADSARRAIDAFQGVEAQRLAAARNRELELISLSLRG